MLPPLWIGTKFTWNIINYQFLQGTVPWKAKKSVLGGHYYNLSHSPAITLGLHLEFPPCLVFFEWGWTLLKAWLLWIDTTFAINYFLQLIIILCFHLLHREDATLHGTYKWSWTDLSKAELPTGWLECSNWTLHTFTELDKLIIVCSRIFYSCSCLVTVLLEYFRWMFY